MDFIISFFDLLFTLLSFAIIARALLSWVRPDPYNPLVQMLNQITDPILEPLRRVIPPIGGMMDISPIVALIILQILQTVVHNVLVNAFY